MYALVSCSFHERIRPFVCHKPSPYNTTEWVMCLFCGVVLRRATIAIGGDATARLDFTVQTVTAARATIVVITAVIITVAIRAIRFMEKELRVPIPLILLVLQCLHGHSLIIVHGILQLLERLELVIAANVSRDDQPQFLTVKIASKIVQQVRFDRSVHTVAKVWIVANAQHRFVHGTTTDVGPTDKHTRINVTQLVIVVIGR